MNKTKARNLAIAFTALTLFPIINRQYLAFAEGKGNHEDKDHKKDHHGSGPPPEDIDNFWTTTGNAGTSPGANFIGTTDDQPLELKVNAQRALRLEPNTHGSPNVIGGASVNFVAPRTLGAVIGGGGIINSFGNILSNGIRSDFCVIGGGLANSIDPNARGSVIGGGFFNTVQTNALDSTIPGGNGNTIGPTNLGCAIGGGGGNTIESRSDGAVIGGGAGNMIGYAGPYTIIAGGGANNIGAFGIHSTISGGFENAIQTYGQESTIGGGHFNTVTSNAAFATISGGDSNTGGGYCATVPGGQGNSAFGGWSFAAGRHAMASHAGTFVWADSSDPNFTSVLANQFAARCTGGAAFVTGIDASGNATTGVVLPAGSGSWSSVSDRNLKENFQPVDPREVLNRVGALPIGSWNYITQDKSTRHIGPTAQDFHAAFAVGEDDKHIATVDADGVALAAIQGMYQLLQEKDAKLKSQQTELNNLNERVIALEKLLQRFK